LTVRYPDASRELNRWLPIVKPLLAIVITGRHPRPLFDFIVGYLRWSNRVVAYAFMLATDEYPPFRLGA
jgi:hypothetical protein